MRTESYSAMIAEMVIAAVVVVAVHASGVVGATKQLHSRLAVLCVVERRLSEDRYLSAWYCYCLV